MEASTSLHRATIVILAILMVLPLPSVGVSAEDGDLSVSYEYHFSSPTVALDTDERVFTLEGLSLEIVAGAPSLPVENLLLALRPGYTLKDVEVSSSPSCPLEIIEDYPRNPFESPTGSDVVVGEIVDREAWDLAGTYVLEGVDIVCLNLRPLVWDRDTGRLSFISDYTVTLVGEENGIDWLGDLDRVRDLVDNPHEVPDLARRVPMDVLPAGSYDHLIITDEALAEPFLSLAEWKGERNELGSSSQDIDSVVVTLQYILAQNAFWGTPASHDGTGNDTQTVVRNFIIAAHEEWGVGYVLLGGDEDVIPSRKVWVKYFDKHDELPADIYYTGLDGNWDDDMDGIYGESHEDGSLGEEADMLAEVYVGRAPVSNAQEAWNFVNKTIDYESGYVGQYSVDLVFVGEELDSYTYGDDYKDEVYDEVLADEGLDLTTLYEGEGTFSAAAFISEMNFCPHIINHMGHGYYYDFAHIDIYDVMDLENDIPFILYTQACMVAGFDQGPDTPYDSIAEEFVKGENGAVAFIGNSRYGWYASGSTDGSSQKFDISFFSQVFDDNVTQLGRALSWSKEEWATSASSSNTIRWVYMELNLLGDPETSVLKAGQGGHDLAAQDISVDGCVLGEEAYVYVLVDNLGQFSENATVSLMADDILVDEANISLNPGQSNWVTLSWTPAELRPYVLTAIVECAADGTPENDQIGVGAWVDQRVSSYTLWENLTKELGGGLMIEYGATLDIRNCTIGFLSADRDYQVRTNGTLLVNGSSFSGSNYLFTSNGGEVTIIESDLSGLSTENLTRMNGGSLQLRDTVVRGGLGWELNGTAATMSGCQLLQQASEWKFNGSSVSIEHVSGQGGQGLRLVDSVGQLSNLTWTEGSAGLNIEGCSGLALRDLELTGNDVDFSLTGTIEGHFLNDLERVNVTYGPVVILHQEDGVTVDGDIGVLYLVDCHDTVIRGLRLGGTGQGLTLHSCTGIEIVGNAIENCSVGIMAIDSEALVWSNDLLDNGRQVQCTRSSLIFGREYPAGGNHWSDLITEDVKSGEGQDLEGADGIADDAYDTEDAFDQYPKVLRCSTVYDIPNAGFLRSTEIADRVSAVTFTYIGVSGSGIANWTWDLGDGALAYGEQVNHTYLDLGVVQVGLTVTDHKGSSDTKHQQFEVVNLLPKCDFSYAPAQPLPGDPVSFQDLSSDADGALVTWDWDFGDGGTSTATSPLHAFASKGDYLVTLVVVDGEGGSGVLARKVVVGNEAPTVNFIWSPSYVTSLQEVLFIDQSSDPDGQVVSWHWDFGDGFSGDGSTVTHLYTSIGTYQVTLTVTDDDDAQAMTAGMVTVNNVRPTASFICVNEVLSLMEVKFMDRSSDPDGRIRSWRWYFGDGSNSSAASPTHTYERPGCYDVALTVTDNLGSSSTTVKVLTVLNRLPEVVLIAPEGEHWSLETVEFNAIGLDKDGEVTSYRWDMGDGSTEEGISVTHVYLAPGNYTVTLTCEDDTGGEASVSVVFPVSNLLPEVTLHTSGLLEHPLAVSFYAEVEDRDGEIVGYNWSFGDGGRSEEASPDHRFAQEGEYTVTLRVTDDHGGWSEAFVQVNVWIGDLSLQEASCYLTEDGWMFRVKLVNEGPVPVSGILYVNVTTAEGFISLGSVIKLQPGERKTVYEPLGKFDNGQVNATLIFPEGWDSDTGDTSWATTVSVPYDSPMWALLTVVGLVAVAVVAVVVRMRR